MHLEIWKKTLSGCTQDIRPIHVGLYCRGAPDFMHFLGPGLGKCLQWNRFLSRQFCIYEYIYLYITLYMYIYSHYMYFYTTYIALIELSVYRGLEERCNCNQRTLLCWSDANNLSSSFDVVDGDGARRSRLTDSYFSKWFVEIAFAIEYSTHTSAK